MQSDTIRNQGLKLYKKILKTWRLVFKETKLPASLEVNAFIGVSTSACLDQRSVTSVWTSLLEKKCGKCSDQRFCTPRMSAKRNRLLFKMLQENVTKKLFYKRCYSENLCLGFCYKQLRTFWSVSVWINLRLFRVMTQSFCWQILCGGNKGLHLHLLLLCLW